MMRELSGDVSVRQVRADDWEPLRSLRFQALEDPMAPVAFLETVAQAQARPDEEWRTRTANNALGVVSVQFVAERDGRPIGTLTVIVRTAGAPDYFARVPEVDLPTVVGVYVAPAGRGLGVIDALLALAGEWARARGDRELTLDVHETNRAAIGAYERSGFERVSEFDGENGLELGYVKQLRPAS